MKQAYIGIDPGKNGATVVMRDGAGMDVMRHKDYDLNGYCAAMREICLYNTTRICLIESVHAMPGQGVSSTFAFGRDLGQRETAVTASGIELEFVTPQAWQKEFGLIVRKQFGVEPLTKTQKKNKHKMVAQKLFPFIKVTHATADALLIAEYAKRTYR